MDRAQELLLGGEEDRQQYAQARPYLEEILDQVDEEDGPGNAEAELFAHRWLGRLDTWADDWASSAVHLERAVELQPADAAVWAELGDVRTRLGDIPGGLEAIREAVALDPEEPMYVFALGNLYMGPLEQPRRALAFLERAAAKRPDQAATLLSLGRCLAALGRADEARARLERARELGAASPRLRAAVDAAIQQLTEELSAASPALPSPGAEPATGPLEPEPGMELADTDDENEDGGPEDEDDDESLLSTAGAMLEGFLDALGTSKDQAIGAVLTAVLGDQVDELHQKHNELAEKTPGMETFERKRFIELIGERVRLAFKEGMENATEEELARGRKIDDMLRVDELGIDPAAFADALAEDDDDDDDDGDGDNGSDDDDDDGDGDNGSDDNGSDGSNGNGGDAPGTDGGPLPT